MPLTIELRDRAGNVLGAVGESWDSISAMWPDLTFEDFPLIAGVDRDDITVFNRLQMSRVVGELERLLDDSPAQRQRLVSGIIELARRGSQTVDAQLWFVGD